MKRGTPAHPKTIDLSERLDIPVYAAVGLLEMLWHYVGDYTPQGNVGKVSDRVIARAVQWDKEPSLLIDALVESKWLDRSEQYRLIVHDWDQHAEELVRKRLSRMDGGLEFLPEYTNPSLRKALSDNGGQCPTMDASRGARLGNGPDVATALASVEDGGLGEETVPEDDNSETAATPKSVVGLWKRIIPGNPKQSDRRLIEQKATELPLSFEEWELRITAYRNAPWAIENKHPVRGFLKSPREWEPPIERRNYEIPMAAELRKELALRRVEPSTDVCVSGTVDIWQGIIANPIMAAYFHQFTKRGHEVTEREALDTQAAMRELRIGEEEIQRSTGAAERMFPSWTRIPGPGNFLRNHKPWNTLRSEVVKPTPDSDAAKKQERLERRAKVAAEIEKERQMYGVR
jgi:hypothetical protein